MDMAKLNFLVAEDHEFQRNNLVRMLRDIGAERIVEADDGQSALVAAGSGKWRPHIIICDLDMPEMDGMELVRRMVEREIGASFILSSSLDSTILASAENMTRAYGGNVLGVLPKPASPARLAALIGKFRETNRTGLSPAEPRSAFSLADIADAMLEGSIAPYYQPKVDMATGKVVGAESLARWKHPGMGVLSPADFMAPLIAHDLMDSLTLLMVKRSAADILQWREAGLDLSVSINLSRDQICDTAVTGRILSCLLASNLPNSNLTFEVAESDKLTGMPGSLETLTRLRMKGFGLSIDDFRGGDSAIAHLPVSPFSEIKIERSRVSGIHGDPALQSMMAASIELARQLVVQLVAQGVESEEDWNTLAGMGCDLAQGYFIAPPMDAGQFVHWAAKWQAPRRTMTMDSTSGPRREQAAGHPAGENSSTRPVAGSPGLDAIGSDRDIEREIFADYRETTLVDLADLDRRIAAKDARGIARGAHRICGASKVVAAHEVVAACDRVERACVDGQWPAIVAGYDKLKRAANRAIAGTARQ